MSIIFNTSQLHTCSISSVGKSRIDVSFGCQWSSAIVVVLSILNVHCRGKQYCKITTERDARATVYRSVVGGLQGSVTCGRTERVFHGNHRRRRTCQKRQPLCILSNAAEAKRKINRIRRASMTRPRTAKDTRAAYRNVR